MKPWLSLGVALTLGACAHGRCPVDRITSPDMALQSLRRPAVAVSSLRAEATVDQRGREGRVKGRVLMFAERPDHLRFDVMTQFGPALVLTTDGNRFALNDFKSNRFFTGPACARNIARLIGVALEAQAVASVLLGEAPELPAAKQTVRCTGEGSYLLERVSDKGEREDIELGILPEDLKKPAAEQHTYLRSVVLRDAAGKRLYRVSYEDYGYTGKSGPRFPFTVRIEDFVNDADALLRFRSIDLNVRVPDGAFQQVPAPTLPVEELSCD